MNKKQIILIGGGGHCKSCIEVIESNNEFEIVGIVDTKDKIGQEVLGYKIFASDNDLSILVKKYKYALITIGQIKSAKLRIKLFDNAKKIGFIFPVIIASTAYVSQYAEIEEGTILMHHVLINADVKIGKNNIINSKALIEHDTVVGSHNHISTNTVLNGGISIGNECFLGSNSTFVQGLSIANKVIIGLNSIVHKSIDKSGTYIGNPLRKTK